MGILSRTHNLVDTDGNKRNEKNVKIQVWSLYANVKEYFVT